jgi:late competence protein required for DNA uptake (superfamily II DNA/RNA helicase)
MYDYEKIIFDSLVTQNGNIDSYNKHLWIKKATGLGISEFMLRFMAWLCLKDNSLSGSQMCIVTGPRIDLAIALIDRMKKLFAGKNLAAMFDTRDSDRAKQRKDRSISITSFRCNAWVT